MSKPKKQRLGRGLEALLGEGALAGTSTEREGEMVSLLPLAALTPNPYQPRKEFREPELSELAASIRENGLLQPLVARPDPAEENGFQLVAGERRFRALSRLGWAEAPVIVRQVEDRTLLVLALVENLQREALGPLEEAEGYQALSEEFGLTQGEVAEVVGKSRSTVANMLRLLRLPPSIRRLLGGGELDMGHARALLALEDPIRIADLGRKAAQKRWSVRQVEEEVRTRAKGGAGAANATAKPPPPSPVLKALEEELQAVLGARVRLKGGRTGKGAIEIPFRSADDFDRIFAHITGRESSDVAG